MLQSGVGAVLIVCSLPQGGGLASLSLVPRRLMGTGPRAAGPPCVGRTCTSGDTLKGWLQKRCKHQQNDTGDA